MDWQQNKCNSSSSSSTSSLFKSQTNSFLFWNFFFRAHQVKVCLNIYILFFFPTYSIKEFFFSIYVAGKILSYSSTTSKQPDRKNFSWASRAKTTMFEALKYTFVPVCLPAEWCQSPECSDLSGRWLAGEVREAPPSLDGLNDSSADGSAEWGGCGGWGEGGSCSFHRKQWEWVSTRWSVAPVWWVTAATVQNQIHLPKTSLWKVNTDFRVLTLTAIILKNKK